VLTTSLEEHGISKAAQMSAARLKSIDNGEATSDVATKTAARRELRRREALAWGDK
jgi:hypothetical protein